MNTIATTKIWDIKVRLDHVIDYITDLDKTKNLSYGDDFSVFHNNELLDIKTEKECYISAINCNVDTAYNEMMITKRTYSKTDGILGFHAYQSFGENEVTPEIAHQIGVQLANEMWGDRFEVIVSTHQNTKHIHNHFVINSVSFKDGKKYYDNHINYAKLRRLSDNLCAEYNLSVLPEKKTKGGLLYNNFYNNYVDHSEYYKMVKEDVNFAILSAYSYKNFLDILESIGYKIIIRNNILSLVKAPHKERVSLSRAFGKQYNKFNILKRINNDYLSKNTNFLDVFFNKRKSVNSIYGLFKYYCYLLKVFSKSNYDQYLDYYTKRDIKEFDYIMEQTNLLSNNNIVTDVDLFALEKSYEKRINLLLDKLEKTNYKKNKTFDESELTQINNDRLKYIKEIKDTRYNLRLIDEIRKRKEDINNNLNKLENRYRKEVDKDELRRSC